MIDRQNEIADMTGAESQVVLWTGRSGRRYTMMRERGDAVAMAPAKIYLLSVGDVIRWAGTAGDLIDDHASRARFRQASARGAQMLSMPAPEDELARMTLVWDLDGMPHYPGRNAA
ncbi:hypothetical protein [Pelagibacterium xiamenense]|uniref:hypothetical protein n=1 Tax=Pelagibacterium xiamenense TaxID=2901140 RepID=UPI001E3C3E67|nr:hypothetical protein [Pelagibacterium xiamenense]MCD7061292.1 hypothetical protein [Pelagibacterium xiamenense]